MSKLPLGEPLAEQDVEGGVEQAQLDAGLGELGLEQFALGLAPWVLGEGRACAAPAACRPWRRRRRRPGVQPACSSSCLAAWVLPLP